MLNILTSIRHFNAVRRRQFYTPERLRQYQFECLKKTLKFAFTRIPYYMETYRKAGLHYDDIQTWEDFKQIPVLTKNEKRSNPPEAFLPDGFARKKVWASQTTGSSGIPLTVYRNQDSAAKDRALMHYCFSTLGIKIYHRFCQLSAVVSEKPNRPGPLARLGIKRNHIVNLRLTDEEMIRQIKAVNPHVIYAFPSVLLRLAEFIQARKISLNVRWLISQGEVLPESWRTTIQQAFSAPLYHTYGATELARIGFECQRQKGYHLISDAAIVEVLNEGLPANDHEEGELIVTNLNNFCSPLIRYQIGDRGILSSRPCLCGIRYPLLEHVTGRMDDFMILPSGRKVSARAVTHMRFKGILQYKIIQKSRAQFQVLVIPSADFTQNTVNEIRRELLAGCLGEDVSVEIKVVETLPVSRTGKLQIVSREF